MAIPTLPQDVGLLPGSSSEGDTRGPLLPLVVTTAAAEEPGLGMLKSDLWKVGKRAQSGPVNSQQLCRGLHRAGGTLTSSHKHI